MKHYLCLAFLILFALAGCKEEQPVDEGKLAAHAAKTYYDYLLHGKEESFFEGMDMPKRLPANYKAQMILGLKSLKERWKNEDKKLTDCSILRNEFREKDSTAVVFLNLHFSDKTSEQIVVSMIKRKGLWYMR